MANEAIDFNALAALAAAAKSRVTSKATASPGC
jgi:hypothetical protein